MAALDFPPVFPRATSSSCNPCNGVDALAPVPVLTAMIRHRSCDCRDHAERCHVWRVSGHLLPRRAPLRICLLYSDTAGDAVSVPFLRAAFEKAGHTLAHAVQTDRDLDRVLQESIDIVVASGGDGT